MFVFLLSFIPSCIIKCQILSLHKYIIACKRICDSKIFLDNHDITKDAKVVDLDLKVNKADHWQNISLCYSLENPRCYLLSL